MRTRSFTFSSKTFVSIAFIAALAAFAEEREMVGLTLEVRAGNRAAFALYHKHGFKAEGYRKNYYAETKEDAVIMWKHLGCVDVL